MTPNPRFRASNFASTIRLTSAVVFAGFAAGAHGQSLQVPTAAPPPVVASPAAPAPEPVPRLREGVAAIVNDNVISTYDLNQRVRLLLVTTGVRPTAENLPQIEREALSSLIDDRLEVQEIKREEKEQKFSIMADDDDVKREVERIAESNGNTPEQLMTALAQAGVRPSTLREQLRTQISWQRWIQGRYGGSRLKISPDRINAVIHQIEAEAAKPHYLLGEVFIDANHAGGMDAAMSGATQIVAELQKGAPFQAVARQFSGASTAANGGDTGWLSAAELRPEVREVVEQMRPGGLSKPIPVRDGVYIIMLRDKRSGAGGSLVSLKQAAISLPTGATPEAVEAAQQKLLALKARVKGCDALGTEGAKVDGVISNDLGEADPKDLAPAFRQAAEKLALNEVSDPIRTNVGLHLIALCGKRQAGVTLPPREEIEARLADEQLSLRSKRYLRDLRQSATIETR